jgi:hypothetical protein
MRSRNIKPGFFKNDALAELSPLARILFAGLWCMADREGRLADRPKRIRGEVLPYDDCDVDGLLDELHEAGFIVRYVSPETPAIAIPEFTKHQNPHIREAPSRITPPTAPIPDLPGGGLGAEAGEVRSPSGPKAQDKHSARPVPAPDKPGASTGQAQEKHRTSPADSQEQEQDQKQEQDQERHPPKLPDAPPTDSPALQGVRSRGTRLPPGWTPPDAVVEAMRAECPGVDQDRELLKFRDHWAAATKNATKADWSGAYRNWIRKERDFQERGRLPARPSKRMQTLDTLDAVNRELESRATRSGKLLGRDQ